MKSEKKNNAEERAPALEAIATTAAKKRWNTNIGVGMGGFLQVGGFSVAQVGWANSELLLIILGLGLFLVSIPVFIWGCMNYAESKGYSKVVGLVGLLGFIGLTVLVLLPEKVSTDLPVSRLKDVGWICMLVGCVIFVWGLWAFSWVQTQKSSYPHLSSEQRQTIALAEGGVRYIPGTTDIEPLGWYERSLYGMHADAPFLFLYIGGCLVYISLFMIIYRRKKPQPENAHEGET